MSDITILYQNTKIGDAFDITSLVSSVKWSTKRTASPASVELSVIADNDIAWEHGGIIAVKEHDTGLFYGYVFKLSQNEKGIISVTAFDQTRYLKNKNSYSFVGLRADEITAMVVGDFGVDVGVFENTGYIIPSLIEDNQTLFDIILKALDLTLINSGKMFYLWDDFGSLRISDVEKSKLSLIVGDYSGATGYTYASDIDSDTYNEIKLTRDNKETGKRDVYLFQDSNNKRLWGILQTHKDVDEELNASEIKAMGEQLLGIHNRPKRSFDLSALSDTSVRAGCALFIEIKDVNISQFFIVDECEHDLLKGVMNLKLKVV